ncbi:uncharacterized mitochondrial protein AtMg00810-like [Lactuca sativa]|uniref:uncharacterized mitochondrial protein AtMg00810-like n=1 Tax=Lactuca sativa TaxID=4236 RepID=UPI000CD90940|nr:uncharacterized mitochondrial protein AtMg00810-like [Lactuca sativa]
MLVYVDDIILMGNSSSAIENVVHTLSHTFALQDKGPLSYFLGIEIVKQGHDLLLSQKKYILEILQRSGLSHAKPVLNPITTTTNQSLGDSPEFDNPVKYRQIVETL